MLREGKMVSASEHEKRAILGRQEAGVDAGLWYLPLSVT